jgi:hypothetical protein
MLKAALFVSCLHCGRIWHVAQWPRGHGCPAGDCDGGALDRRGPDTLDAALATSRYDLGECAYPGQPGEVVTLGDGSTWAVDSDSTLYSEEIERLPKRLQGTLHAMSQR